MRFRLYSVLLLVLAFLTGPHPAWASVQAYRASILHFIDDPNDFEADKVDQSYQYFEDGILLVKDGKVSAVGPADQILPKMDSKQSLTVFKDKLIIPGFIDSHIHYPQTEMIAAFGEELLPWLNNYTFPTENQYKDKSHASKESQFFLKELLRNGTTTALIFGTVHKQSVEALFEQALKLNLRIIAGKVLMDRNAPAYLKDTPEAGYKDSKDLIKIWHGKQGRLLYAITPRFAPTSTPAQLASAQKLKQQFPDVYVHTHVSENLDEVAWVKQLFPNSSTYMDVYDQYDLLGPRSVFAHAIHLEDQDWKRLAITGSAISFCPSSNLFLGSGLFNYRRAKDENVHLSIGSDVGAGTTFSIIQNLNEAYKVVKLQGETMSAFEGFYLATLGGAKALYLDQHIGNFKTNKEADFLVLDLNATPLLAKRMANAKDLHEKLFVLMMLGDDRVVEQAYALGQKVHQR